MIIDSAKRVLKIESEAIAEMIERIDGNFVRVVEELIACQGRVVVTGMGKSGLIGKKIAATLASTGKPAFFLHPAEGVHGDLGMVCRGDLVIAISNSGETQEIIRILPVLKRLNIILISLVGNHRSTLARNSDLFIDISVKEEACSMGLIPTASTTAALAMGDALAIALLEKKGFKEEDFASFHPGGSLGKRLLMKVEDVMHKGDKIPVVSEDTLMKDAIYEISSKKLGVTIVMDRDDRISGIITDGDLRRLLVKEVDILHKRAGEVMTRNPKTIDRDSLAAKAVGVMENHKITSLVVADKQGKIEGIVHLHDLLELGVI
ncbi:MAG TPA: KpsF/GutQ family sugar-phosphate isomerase [Nitrospiria bacterium]|nr:KpsF/GutQ family sugar-phosphate isomerase [Nitrospiria bacterium]